MENDRENGAKGSAFLTVRLGSELRAKWFAWCKARGLKPTASLRQAVAEQLASAALPEFVETPGAIDSGPRTRFELRLSPTEIDALRARAESEGVAPQLWLIRAMRTQLTGRYQITDAAVQGAAELHQELLTIARNINQVARVLNTTKVISADEMQAVLATHKSNLRDLAELKDQFARILSGYSVRFPLRRVEG